MQSPTDQQLAQPRKYNPHSAIQLPLAIIAGNDTNNIYKSNPILQPFKYEVFCPLSCQGIKIGVYNQKETNDNAFRITEFRTSTSRTVQANVNTNIVYTVNHHKPQNKQKKTTNNLTDYGIAFKVDSKSNVAILNPFYASFDPLSLYVQGPIKQIQKEKVQGFVFEQKQFNAQHFEVNGRKIFYERNKVCYRPIFRNINQSNSLILISDPYNKNRYTQGKVSELKQTIDNNILYWLGQLSLSAEVYLKGSTQSLKDLENIDDVYTQLGYWLNLDEQLRCQLLDSKCANLYKEYYPNFSRLYTAFYRLSSFLNYGNTRYNVVKLAELGFFNRSDLLQNISHYQALRIPIPNIQQGKILSEQQVLVKSLPHLRSLNNLPFPNVPLQVSLSSIPSQTHEGNDIVKIATDGSFFGLVSNDKMFSLWSGEVMLLNYVSWNLSKCVQRKEMKNISVLTTSVIPPVVTGHKCEQFGDLFNQSKKQPEQIIEQIIPDNDKLQNLINMGYPAQLSKKALIAVKNESIQAVIDIIEQIKTEQDEKRKAALSKLKLKNNWTCQQCTMVNQNTSDTCNMCASSAPLSEYIDEQQIQRKEKQLIQDEKNKIEQEKRKQLEKQLQQKKNQQEQIRRKQEQEKQKLQTFVKQSKIVDVKISYLENHSLDPFFISVLLKGQDKSLLRVFRVGLCRNYIEKFVRREPDNTIVSNFNQNIKPSSFESLSEIIKQARRAVHWGRKFFENITNQWIVQQSQDLFFDEQITEISLKQMKDGISLTLTSEGVKLFADILVKDSKDLISFELKKCVEHCEDRNVPKEQNSKAIDNSFDDIRCHKIEYETDNQISIPAGCCYFELEITEHLPRGQFTLKNIQRVERKCEEGGQPLMKNFIPLRIQNFQGSIANDKLSIASVFYPGPLYTSNYSLTNFAFKSLEDRPMIIDSVTIISDLKISSLGYPIRSGLIFVVDQISWFFVGKDHFQYFTTQDYNNWLIQKGNNEPAQWQPVGGFEIKQGQKSVQFDLNFIRPGKIVCLLPTGVKKGKIDFEEASVVIDFFGVKGRVIHENRVSSLKSSTVSQIQAQGSNRDFLRFYTDSNKQQQLNKQYIQIYQKSQLNGIQFITKIKQQALKQLQSSVTTQVIVKLKKVLDKQIQVQHHGHGKLISLKLVNTFSVVQNSALALQQTSQNYPQDLYEAITVNPFLVDQIVAKLDIKRFLIINLLGKRNQLYESWKLIKIFRKSKQLENKLHTSIGQIVKNINDQNVKITPQGLKYFLKLFGELSVNNKPLAVDSLLNIWNLTSDFVNKIRSPNYKILRTKYDIKELILQNKLFSQFYHNNINPQLCIASKNQNTITPPKNMIQAFFHKASTETCNTSYLRLTKQSNIEKVRFYFQKTDLKLKLRLKLYAVDRIGDKSYRKSLIYHRIWDEQLMIQLGNYAFASQNDLYKTNYNYFEIDNVQIKAQYFIFEAHYSLVGSFISKKKDNIQNVKIMPIFISSQTQYKKIFDSSAVIIQDQQFQTKFCFKKTITENSANLSYEGLPNLKDLEQNCYHISKPDITQSDEEEQSLSNGLADQISANILNKEIVLSKKAQIDFKGCYGAKGLDFSYTFIMMINKFVSNSFLKDELLSRSQQLTDVLLKLYDTFVVNEFGPICDNVISMIVQLLEIMDKTQLNRFVIQVVKRYLTNVENLKNKSLTQQYDIKHVLETVYKLKQLPLAQLVDLVNNQSSKLQKICILQLVEHSLKNSKSSFEIFNLTSNTLTRQSSLKQVLDKLFLLSLNLIQNNQTSNLQTGLLNLCLDNILLVINNLGSEPALLKSVIDEFLTEHSKQSLWILIFNALKLPDDELTKKIYTLMKHFIINFNAAFNNSINNIILEIIEKNQNSLYIRINGQVSNEIWMKHLHSMLEFLVKSQQQKASETKFTFSNEIAKRLLELPLTPALWSFTISCLPIDESVLKNLVKSLTPQLWSVLQTPIIKYTTNFKIMQPLNCAGKQWLNLSQKLIIQGVSLLELFIDILGQCNFGGKQGVLMSNEQNIKKLQISNKLLESIVQSNQIQSNRLTSQKLRVLIEWYILNRNLDSGQSPATDLLRSVSDNILKLFNKFTKDKNLVKHCLKELVYLKKQSYIIEKLCKDKAISNYNSIVLTQRICDCFEQLINVWMTTDDLAHYFAFDLQGYDYLFGMIGNVEETKHNPISQEDVFLDSLNIIAIDKQKSQKNEELINNGNQLFNFKEEQLANKVKIIKASGQNLNPTGQDWSTHKKGVKNKLITVPMVGPYEQEYPITVELDRLCQIKYLRMGILTADNSNSTTQGNMIVATPSSISVEGGQDINSLQPIGQLTQINDEGYITNSIKIFVHNFQTVTNQNSLQQSIKSLGYLKVKYLRFIFRRPIVTFIENLSTQTGKNYKNTAFCISFLSITGYDVAKIPNNCEKRCQDIRKKSSLVALSQLFNQSFISTINKLSNQPAFVEKFTLNFKQITSLMIQYGDIISSINYILGANNEQLGDWMIDYYLKNGVIDNYCKLLSQILLSNASKIYPRLQLLLSRLLEIISNTAKLEKSIDIISKFSENSKFLQTFCNSLNSSLSTANSQNKLQLKVQKQDIDNILIVYDVSHAINISHTLIKFLLTLVYVKSPYVLSNDLVQYTLNKVYEKCSVQNIHFYEILNSLLVSKRCRPWLENNNNYIVDTFITNITNLLKENKGNNKLKLVVLQLVDKSAYHLSKYLLEKHNIHIQLYNLVKEKKDLSPEIFSWTRKFIQKIIFNNPGSQKAFMQHMIKDLESLPKRKDPNFLKFYMELLEIEKQIYVTLRNFSNVPKQDFAIPSQLLSKDDQISLVKAISQKSKYSLVLQIKDQFDLQKFDSIVNSINEPPFLIIAQFGNNDNNSIIVGAYSCSNVQSKKLNTDFSLLPNKSSFIFSMQPSEIKQGNKKYDFYYNDGQVDFAKIVYDNNEDQQERKIVFYGGENNSFEFNFSEEKENSKSTQNMIVDKMNYKLKKIQLWDILHLRSEPKVNVQLTQADIPLVYYRPEPVYAVPANVTSQQLLSMIHISSKLVFNGKQVEKDKILDNYVEDTDDFILDMDISLTSSTTLPTKKYVPNILLYKQFEKQEGAEKLFNMCDQIISTWTNQSHKNRWIKFIGDFQVLKNIPGFVQVSIKNVNIFKIVVDILLGTQDQHKFTKEWPQIQSKLSVCFFDYFYSLLNNTKTKQMRKKLIDDNFLEIVLNKLHVSSKQTVRKLISNQQETHQQSTDKHLDTTQNSGKTKQGKEAKQVKKKKKGTGYGSDYHNNNTTKWNTLQYIETKKQIAEQIYRNIKIIAMFLNTSESIQDEKLPRILKQSCLLPLIENALRSSSILDVSKQFNLFMAYLDLVKGLSKNSVTLSCLLPLQNIYQPVQTQSIFVLLQKLKKTADIYISCLSTMSEKNDKNAEQIGLQIKSTYDIVQKAIKNINFKSQDDQMVEVLKLPLNEAYKKLLGPLRFDTMSMKQKGAYKHYYLNMINSSSATPPPAKILRLSQQLADLSSSLPYEHTNSIFVRCDKDRIDVVRIMIMGSKDTPYSNGAFLFDLFCQDSYPNQPPKMVITTTGGAKIRFNPNLYADGKVCLSLLGTWKGQTTQNWDPKLSTLLQLFISTQSIIMNEDIYFNEPGYEGEQGQVQGQKKNQGYSNIVRLGNIKFAMIDQIKNPPKGFQEIVHRHFYLKRNDILQECEKWLQYADTKEAAYTNLTNDHNSSWASDLKKSKNAYKQALTTSINELREVLNGLQQPKFSEAVKTIEIKRVTQKQQQQIKGQTLEQIDMTYEKKQADKQLNYEDQKVKDRWSRYIGAMGLEAVKKQSESQVLLIGLGTLGLEIAKNLTLSGLKRLTIVDNEVVKSHTEHFYMSDMPGEYRHKCIFKLQQLNRYVKVDHSQTVPELNPYNIIIDTRTINQDTIQLSNSCRKLSKKYISVESKGVFGRIFNDFGQKFEIADANGEQPIQVLIKSISNQEKGVVKLPQGFKHPYEDGEYVVIDLVEGMQTKQNIIEQKSQQQIFYQKQTGGKISGINGRVFKIQVINSNSFRIGNTTNFAPYIRNGVAKNLKLPKYISFKSFQQSLKTTASLPFDNNMCIYDFDKMGDNILIQMAFKSLGAYTQIYKKLPCNWNHEDAMKFVELVKPKFEELAKDAPADKKEQTIQKIQQFFYEFSLVAESQLPSIDAYLGGLASQQAIKAITNKFSPIQQLFTFHFKQLLPQIPKTSSQISTLQIKLNQPFFNTKVILGNSVTEKLATSNLFVIGAGAIGCELLKNFAMLNICSSGSLVVTDPDHIQTSNLNRQFLFRQKHIKKPKSSTASAAIIQMNPALKGHIVAKLQKVCDQSENIFSDKFFKTLSLVANALDNVQARLYVDRRCVSNKIPLLQSGTLGPKGHVQVIIPYKTQSYGSQNDPTQQNQIPHCTLKLFPEDTIHCIQWSRDIFGKIFTLKPKALKKVIEDVKNKSLNLNEQGVDKIIKRATKAPKNFDDCIQSAVKKFYKYFRNDIRQLLHTYPLTMKTKDGQPFWKLPKRPPKEISQLDPKDELHRVFISSYAVNFAKTYSIAYPKNFRTQQGKNDIMKIAIKVKIPDFVPSEEGSKKINELNNQKTEGNQQTQQVVEQKPVTLSVLSAVTVPTNITQLIPIAEQFEKDQDSNGHIDLIYSMSNLRSKNYELAPYTWIQTKLKAGRIMPALSTTTSVVSALQSIELIKIIKESKAPKNTFANLAVPLIQMSEPGVASKTKIGNTQFTVWDRWQVKAKSLQDVYSTLSKQYEVQPVDSLINGAMVYMKASYKSKPKQEQQFMNIPLRQLLKLQQSEKWIDFTISFKDLKNGELIPTVPIVRVYIE